jgi:hypothetical protein
MQFHITEMALLSRHRKFQTTLRRKQYELNHSTSDLNITAVSKLSSWGGQRVIDYYATSTSQVFPSLPNRQLQPKFKTPKQRRRATLILMKLLLQKITSA